jgi:methylmalonyl-CoA mutase
VADPAAGSGATEDLTARLCATAWTKFQEIEAAGGVWAALDRGILQRNVAKVRIERQKAVARRKDALKGQATIPTFTSDYRWCWTSHRW